MSDNYEIPVDLRFDPTPKLYGEMVTPIQLGQLRSLAAGLRLDLETECLTIFGVRSHELSVDAAAALINRFNALKARKGAAA